MDLLLMRLVVLSPADRHDCTCHYRSALSCYLCSGSIASNELLRFAFETKRRDLFLSPWRRNLQEIRRLPTLFARILSLYFLSRRDCLLRADAARERAREFAARVISSIILLVTREGNN